MMVAGFLGLTYCFYWVAFYNPENRHHEVPYTAQRKFAEQEKSLHEAMESLLWEDVWITSQDGLRLHGRYHHVRDGAGIWIMLHGYRGSVLRDLSAVHAVAESLEYNTLAVELRAHGRSQGKTMTFGVRERLDCVAWADYARRRFGKDTPIFLYGVSMGAATVLMSIDQELPGNVSGIIADCPYSGPEAIIRKVCRDIRIPGWIAVPFGRCAAKLWGGFSVKEMSAVRAVRQSKIPVLLIHGTEDRYVPPEMSRRIQENCSSDCFLELFPGASHAGSCLTDPVRYRKVLEAFTEFCLKRMK